jgi:hypothetical protein
VYVQVSLGDARMMLALRDQDDFTAFKLVIEGEGGWGDLSRALRGTGRVDPPHVWIGSAALRSLGRADDPAWMEGLDAMMAFAGSHGWVDQHGAVRAHCEWAVGEPRP